VTVDQTLLVVEAAVALPGDYNGDNIVDAADYTLWRDHQGAPAGTLLNDPHLGVIGPAQYETWLANFGNTLAGAAASHAIPEPATLWLALALFIGVAGRRR
jgi:hypothetical protein